MEGVGQGGGKWTKSYSVNRCEFSVPVPGTVDPDLRRQQQPLYTVRVPPKVEKASSEEGGPCPLTTKPNQNLDNGASHHLRRVIFSLPSAFSLQELISVGATNTWWLAFENCTQVAARRTVFSQYILRGSDISAEAKAPQSVILIFEFVPYRLVAKVPRVHVLRFPH